ncbi:MAG: hypothetical protein HY897_23325 [Deltaproteobacteria bacterium]|nr:hypothetical protein [Deltaproteobacteria bacterium]
MKATLSSLLAIAFIAACADTEPPALLDVTQLPDTTDTVGPYTVTAVARDDRGVESVTLYYTGDTSENATFKAAVMTQVEDDLYSGEIAGFPAGARVRYFVEAEDASANRAKVPQGNGEYLQFRVIEN